MKTRSLLNLRRSERLIWTIHLFGLLCVGGCSQSETPMQENAPEWLVFGRFYGHCQGEQCIEIYKLEKGKLFEDRNDQYVSNETFYEASYEQLDDAKYEMVRSILDHIPSGLIAEDQIRFGCPDCADQGGIYLEIKNSQAHEFWIFDQNKQDVPAYLHSYLDLINAKIDFLSNE